MTGGVPHAGISAGGARQASGSWFTRLLSRAMSRDLRAFLIPGEDVARASGLDFELAGLSLSGTPRHASVLTVIGDLTPELSRAAAVSYAQMPRPRAIFAVGCGEIPALPRPEVSVAADPESVAAGVRTLEALFARTSFRRRVSDLDIAGTETRTVYTCAMHPEVTREKPGSCPICGMSLTRKEAVERDKPAEGGHEGHEGSENLGSHDEAETGGSDHHHMDQSSMSHEVMEHGDMDFMSMVEMTRDLPRSRDGLAMEWNEGARFGPYFPGLPGGLSLALTLDGDAVINARAITLAGVKPGDLGVRSGDFARRMARLDPLSPIGYRLLASRALEDAAGRRPSEETELARVRELEYERVTSHLGWLAGLGRVLGHEGLRRRSARLQIAMIRSNQTDGVPAPGAEVRKLVGGVRRIPLLDRRLRGVGVLAARSRTPGPVSRADGDRGDARLNERFYGASGFEPAVSTQGDALSRLQVRLEELEASSSLLDTLSRKGLPTPWPQTEPVEAGEGNATVETARGAARLGIRVEGGIVNVEKLSTPSTVHMSLVESLADDTELAEFLVAVASLDISPWEVVL